MTSLLNRLREADTQDQVAAPAARAAAHVPLDHPDGVGWLLDLLLEEGMQDQVATLLARDPRPPTSPSMVQQPGPGVRTMEGDVGGRITG